MVKGGFLKKVHVMPSSIYPQNMVTMLLVKDWWTIKRCKRE